MVVNKFEILTHRTRTHTYTPFNLCIKKSFYTNTMNIIANWKKAEKHTCMPNQKKKVITIQQNFKSTGNHLRTLPFPAMEPSIFFHYHRKGGKTKSRENSNRRSRVG